MEGKGVGATWPGRAQVDAATKAGLLDLVEQAVQAGWEFRAVQV